MTGRHKKRVRVAIKREMGELRAWGYVMKSIKKRKLKWLYSGSSDHSGQRIKHAAQYRVSSQSACGELAKNLVFFQRVNTGFPYFERFIRKLHPYDGTPSSKFEGVGEMDEPWRKWGVVFESRVVGGSQTLSAQNSSELRVSKRGGFICC